MQTPATLETPRKSSANVYADELRDDRQRVENEQVDDTEGAPESAEVLENQSCVADTRYRAQAQHHLVIDERNGDQQQGPEQRRAIVLASLSLGAERTGVVVSNHHNEGGPKDGE